jgi:hypothetical protein
MFKNFFLICLVIFSLELSSKDKFSSAYLDFSKDCKSQTNEDGEDAPLVCSTPSKKYTLTVTYSACFETILVESKDKKEIIEFSNQPIGSADKRKMEWRFYQNQPVGIIYRMNVMKQTPDENCPETSTKKEKLEIRGLGKFSKLNESASGKNANEKARGIIDKFVLKQKN